MLAFSGKDMVSPVRGKQRGGVSLEVYGWKHGVVEK